MPEPVHTPIGARLRERTQPLAPNDADNGYAHAHLCEGIGRMLAQVAQVFDPEGDAPPLAPILDVDLCPDWALPWLAQLVGVRVPPGAPADEARGLIHNVSGFTRGTPAALEAAASLYLTGKKTVWFRERDGGAYQLEVVTLTGELPETDRQLTNGITNPRPVNAGGWWGGAPPDAPVLSHVVDATSPTGHALRLTGAITGQRWARIVPNTAVSFFDDPGSYVGVRISGRVAGSATQLRVGILWLDNMGNEIAQTYGDAVPVTREWQHLALTAAMPAGAIGAVPAVEFDVASGTLDAYAAAALVASVENASRTPDYGDGSRAGWAWTGGPDSSTSTRTPTTLVRNALLSQKPGGIVMRYRMVDGWDYQQMTTEGGTYAQQSAAFLTYVKLRENVEG